MTSRPTMKMKAMIQRMTLSTACPSLFRWR